VLTASGTVTVDSQVLVRVLSFHVAKPDPKNATDPRGGIGSVIEFRDHGVRVDVTPPPAAQVVAWDRLGLPQQVPSGSGKPSASAGARP
jgi:hypothetical protein